MIINPNEFRYYKLLKPSDDARRHPDKQEDEKASREGKEARRKNSYTILELHRSQMSNSKRRQDGLDCLEANARQR
ncbi:hypothetical protein TNIN_337931 [Trichonephila inaurata madagascariensis]|uniref:Uncharacterized protein n=1 Tax=Trichonephila inaurata madagascariensis TaxID=2747483 RepID=A0A8X6Y2R5_9ARAC|nr:hypothetical protein TNIN_337931 [Trichonephila inaurata madagascariensis]